MNLQLFEFDDFEDSDYFVFECVVVVLCSIWVSVVVNFGFMMIQIVVGLLICLQGLVVDGIYLLLDLVVDFVVLLVSYYSCKGVDEDYFYGYYCYEIVVLLVLGLLLLVVGLGMLWVVIGKFQQFDDILFVYLVVFWVVGVVLMVKELLFCYMFVVVKWVKLSMLVVNVWYVCLDVVLLLVVGLGIVGNFVGYLLLDFIVVVIVGFMVFKMGWEFGWDVLYDLMDWVVDEEEVVVICQILEEVLGVKGVYDLRMCKMGDMIVVDVYMEVDVQLSVEVGYDIVVEVWCCVMQCYCVFNVMIYVDLWWCFDWDYEVVLWLLQV